MIKKIINSILFFLKWKKKPSLTIPSDYEDKILKRAKLKLFKPTIEILQKIAKGDEFTIDLTLEKIEDGFKTIKLPIRIENEREKGLPFTITSQDPLQIKGVLFKESYGLDKSLVLKKGDQEFFVNIDSVFNFKTEFPRRPHLIQGSFKNFKSFDSKSIKGYSRLVIHTDDVNPVFPTEILQYDENYLKFDYTKWHLHFTRIGIPIISTRSMFVELEINQKKFEFYGLEHINSIVIDSKKKIDLEEFKKYSYVIRVCFALLSGKFYRDEVSYLISDSSDFNKINDFEYQLEGPSTLSNNQIINPSFFFQTFETREEEEKENFKEFHKMFDTKVFNNLCEEALESTEFLRTIELILSANNMKDPIQKGALYSVAIETITEHLREVNEKAFQPINDRRIWKSFRKEQAELLNKYKEKIDEDGFKILTSKIDNLNSPTNRDKLVKPFEMYGIELNEEDLEVLNHRNNYLHGGVPITSGWDKELQMIADNLHNLICLLILKKVDYKGHYIKLSGWNLMHTREVKELMQNFDLEEIKLLRQKIADNKLEEKDLSQAQLKLEMYQKYLKSIMEITNTIKIIE